MSQCNPQSGEIHEIQASTEVFCGCVKSFNSRRGFGFLSCEETASRFGRDVYLAKDEAMVLAAEPEVGQAATDSAVSADKDKKAPPPVQEGDALLFQVKLSTEGFPQAVQVRKMRRLRGFVQQAPSPTAEGVIIVTGDGSDKAEASKLGPDAALQQLLGAEVLLRQDECGQLKLMTNDEIAFCCVSVSDSSSQLWEAQLVDLLSTKRDQTGSSVLGCFSLKMPQIGSKHAQECDDGKSATSSYAIEMHGHAVMDCVYLSNVPYDFCAADLMRLFSQLGGKEAKVTFPNGHSTEGFAAITFGGPENVAKFLVQATHTVSENGVTQLAHVGPPPAHVGECFCTEAPTFSTENGQLPEVNHNMQNVAVHDIRRVSAEPVYTAPMVVEARNQMPDMIAPSTDPNIAPQTQAAMNCGQPPAQHLCMPVSVLASNATIPDWRCIHRNIVVPAAAPEVLVVGECSLCIQWPTVVHAHAYVVEILNQTTMTAQRYLHAMPEGPPPFVMDLRVDNLQPSAYAANVRCIAPCGCESNSSSWSFAMLGAMPPAVAPAMPPAVLPAVLPALIPGVLPHVCPPPPSAPPALSMTTVPAPDSLSLPPIPEESLEASGVAGDEILTLD